jgi:ABC-type polysaccharide/polyol phosphate export permease
VAAEAMETWAAERGGSARGTVKGDLAALRRYRSLIRYLYSATLRTEKTGSVFGFMWWLLDPLLLMLIYWFIFSEIFKRTEKAFPIFLLISLLSWEFFTKSLQRSIGMVLNQERSMRQLTYPRSAIPIALTLTQLSHFLFGVVIAAVAADAIYGISPSGAIVGVVPLALAQGAFTLGAAFFFATLNLFFRDVEHLLAAALLPWFFLTPVLWQFAGLPERVQRHHALLDVLRWGNFVAPPIAAVRDAIWSGHAPRPADVAYLGVAAIVALGLGAFVFTRVDERIAIEL